MPSRGGSERSERSRGHIFVRRLLSWGRNNRRSFPWREETDPFRILVAEVLLQRSRGKTVAKVYEDLFGRWPAAQDLARAPLHQVEAVIYPLGLWRRASTLKALASEVETRAGVPSSVEELMALTGVGRYAASATLAAAFGRSEPTVDAVTARVYRRYFNLPSDQPPSSDKGLWTAVTEVTPRRSSRDWNWAVLDLAAEICRPKRPRCPACPLSDTCAWASRHHPVSAGL